MVSFFLASGQVHRLGTDHGDNNKKKKVYSYWLIRFGDIMEGRNNWQKKKYKINSFFFFLNEEKELVI